MPYKPNRPCRYPGCPNVCDSGVYCKEHIEHASDRLRGGANKRGYDSRWRKARALFLRHHPLCVICLRHWWMTPATVVDHIVPHRGDEKLFWDKYNWQALCKACHDEKTGSGL